uniref:Ig-like domain-containing protein n=1 Tax=Tetraodon nigroviridis TaxID=99883 RepID=H3CVU7_TETNG
FGYTLYSAWTGVHALNVNIPKDVYEFARGDNITLPCVFVPKKPPSLVIITWTVKAEEANAEGTLILTHYSAGSTTDIVPAYESRTALDYDVALGKADLKLSSITLADNKVFECRVQIPGDDEGKLADTARLVVLVAPSVPDCAVQGKAEYGQNINLTCKSEEGSPPPTYKWEGRDVRNMPRVRDPKTTDKDGILSLYNISKETSGYYTCTSANKIRSAQCNLTLSVMPPSLSLGSTGTILGVVGGIIGLIMIIVIIYCCCCRKKKQDGEYEKGDADEAKEDIRDCNRYDEHYDETELKNGENRRPDGEEDIAERRDHYDEKSKRNHDDRHRDYDDNRGRRSDRNDRDRDYNDRRSDYNDRRSDYNDRDRRDRYNDRYDRRDDEADRERRYDDRHYDEPYNDRESDRPRVPALKPPRKDYDN